MSLENGIRDAIGEKMNDGTIEKIVQEQVAAGVTKAVSGLFSSYGDMTKMIEGKIKEVMVPYLESYDYTKYIAKLDSVLVDILKETSLDNKKLLTNFKSLMLPTDLKEIKLSEIFKIWMEFVAENVETDGLEINFDDSPSYDYVEVTLEVEEAENRYSSSSFKYANVIFDCEHDEDMSIEFKISQFNYYPWDLEYKTPADLNSLSRLNTFETFLMRLKQANTNIIVDIRDDSDSVRPNAEPEPGEWS